MIILFIFVTKKPLSRGVDNIGKYDTMVNI